MDSNSIKIFPKSIVCEETNLFGDITISSGCVIHPSATIRAEKGPIILGENCIVEEYATIINRQQPKNAPNEPFILNIGHSNVFEIGCTVEACQIGDKNVFESKCVVGPEVEVTSGCIIGAGIKVNGKRFLKEHTVLYGQQWMQREAIEKQVSQILQIDFLRKVLPNYHHLRKQNFDAKKLRNL